jgi:hypothetical protein
MECPAAENLLRDGDSRPKPAGIARRGARLLPSVATAEQVTKLAINKIIFDAGVAGQADRNIWNIDSGVPHSYDDATLAAHRTDIYFAVNA